MKMKYTGLELLVVQEKEYENGMQHCCDSHQLAA